MSSQDFELKDFTKPVYLHFENEKFWEIKLIQKPSQSICETVVRCGKLVFGREDPLSLTSQSKNHADFVQGVEYVEKHTRIKLEKGYKIVKTEDTSSNKGTFSQSTGAYSINVLPPKEETKISEEPRNLKRKAETDHQREDTKRTKEANLLANDDKDSETMSTFSYFPGERDSQDSNSRKSARPNLDDDFFDSDPFGGNNQKSNRSAPAAAEKDKYDDDFFDDDPFTRPAGLLRRDVANNKNSQNEEKEERKQNDSKKKGDSVDILSDPNFKGTYLTNKNPKGTMTCKIQVLGKYVKCNIGALDTDKFDNNTLIQFRDEKEAILKAKEKVNERLAKGYKFEHSKFVFDLRQEDLDSNDRSFLHNIPKSPRNSNGSNTSTRGKKPANSSNLNLPDKDDDDKYSVTSRRSGIDDEDDDDDGLNNARIVASEPSSPSGLGNKDQSLGKPVSAPYSSVMLAQSWEDKGGDPTGWYMSEKLDGVRCFWTGTQMYSRSGKRYFPPKFFTKDFPNSPLDGELWTGRSTFQKCVSIVRKQNPIDNEWKNVIYMVFDAPAMNAPFKKRYEKMKAYFDPLKSPFIRLLKHEVCTGYDQLKKEQKRVEQLGGEGMMIRDPDSMYEQRRSAALLKVKTFSDAEATVIGHEPGSGRCLGMTGALRCRNKDGIEFSVGSGLNDAMRRKPPKIGSVITYKFQGVSDSGTPRFPTFLRIYPGDI